MVTRRTLIAAGSLAVGMGPLRAQTGAPKPAGDMAGGGRMDQAPGFYRFKVGDIEVTAIHDGFANRPLDGLIRNAELADVKRAMGDAFLPDTALPITFTPLVVRTGGKTVLIDTGNGDTGAATSGRWLANFKAAGFDPAQVDIVVISHFHGDHIGGLRMKDGTAPFVSAEVKVPTPEWDFWMDEGKMSAAPDGMKPAFQNVRRVFSPMKDVTRYEPGKEVAPGITSVAAFGHTPGHSAFVIASGGKTLTMVSDITNHPALFVRNPTWAAVFDMNPDQARDTRVRMLDMAASERTPVSFYHAPFPASGHILKEGAGFRFVPTQWTHAL